MPIFEYFCPDNNRIYQFFAKTQAQAQSIPKCPDNPAFRMVKMVSGFAIGNAGKKSVDAESGGGEAGAPATGEPGGPGAGAGDDGPDDARMEAMFSELERDMGSVDENDPRAMGRMMRKMSEMTGEKLDGQMEEMVRKLEEGQDPEKLEEEMGDAMGDDDGAEDGYGGMGGGFGGGPSRDPHLYDY